MLSSPRRLALSWRAVRRCSVRCLIRSVRSAIWTSGEPVSLSSRRYAVITSFLFGSVADGTRCPFLILWISYSLMSLPDAERSAERSQPRKGRGDRIVQLVEAAFVGRSRLRPEELHRAERLVEHRDAIARARKRKSELGELGLVPARPDPELEAPVREVIDGDRDLRHESRVPV